MRSSSIGSFNYFSGVQTAICYETAQMQINKQAIGAVPSKEAQQGFRFGYLLIPKKESASLCPTLDFRVFNRQK